MNFSPENEYFFENRKRKVLESLENIFDDSSMAIDSRAIANAEIGNHDQITINKLTMITFLSLFYTFLYISELKYHLDR